MTITYKYNFILLNNYVINYIKSKIKHLSVYIFNMKQYTEKIFNEFYFTSLHQVLTFGTMELSQNFISGATSSLFIFVCVGAQRVLQQREEEHKLHVLQYLDIFAMGRSKKSLIISSWIAHLPVLQDPETEIIHLHSVLFNFLFVQSHKISFLFKLLSETSMRKVEQNKCFNR